MTAPPDGWLPLGTCPLCRASRVPRAYITNQGDLDAYLGSNHGDTDGIPMESDGDPAHHQNCPHAAQPTS